MFPDLYEGFLLGPDDGAGSGSSGETDGAAAATPAVTPDSRGSEGSTVSSADQHVSQNAPLASTQTPAPVAPTAAAPGTPTPAPAAAAPAQFTVAGVRDFARSVGIDPAQYADDQTMLRDIVAAAQQANAYRGQLQQLSQQNAGLLQRLTAPMAQPVTQPAATDPMKKFFNAPEYNAQWEQMLTRDAQGNVNGVKPGAPYDILQKYQAAQNYRRDFAEKLLSNPAEALGPMVQHMAQEQAGKLIEQHLQTYQDRTWTDNFVTQNSGWLHARDAAGNTIQNQATGKPMLSPAGQRFGQYVVEAERLGVRNIQAQENYARSLLERDLLRGHQQQAAAGGNGLAAQQAAVAAGNRRQPNLTGTLPGTGPIPATVAQNPGLSLRDQMAQAMAQNGVTDDQVQI